MMLIILYVTFIAIFGFTSVLIGYTVESMWGSVVSMIVFLVINSFALWAAWVIAVKLTEPKGSELTQPKVTEPSQP